MRTLPPGLLADSHRISDGPGFVWLVEMTVDVSTEATTMVRVCTAEESLALGTATYYPFPFKISGIRMDGERKSKLD